MPKNRTSRFNMGSGRALEVVRITEDHSYELDKKALSEILLGPAVASLPVVVISVAGAFRGGKSFILNFFLRFLYYMYMNADDNEWEYVNGTSDDGWFGNERELKGFGWCPGNKSHTTGILMWSQAFPVTLSTGEKVAVILMDTQGTFDDNSTIQDCSTIFGMSMLISSMQIYNVGQIIREDTLQHLQLFTQYGKLASNGDKRPFQKLMFLIRDWSYYEDYPFGVEGGKLYLKDKLEVRSSQADELRNLRRDLKNSFDEVNCFLMPYPGEKVASEKDFKGNVNDMTENFRNSIKELVPLLFAPDKLIPRRINGETVTGSVLVDYIKSYMKLFQSGKLPKPVSLMKATERVAVQQAAAGARREFSARMEAACGAGERSAAPAALRAAHRAARDAACQRLAAAIDQFIVHDDDDDDEDLEEDERLIELRKELDDLLSHYEVINNSKVAVIVENTKSIYEEEITKVSSIPQICLHSNDLQEVHKNAVTTAMSYFNEYRTIEEGENDEERTKIENEFKNRYTQLEMINDKNNRAAVVSARDQYIREMERQCGAQPCMNGDALEAKDRTARSAAYERFTSARNYHKVYSFDKSMTDLKQEMDDHFTKLQSLNTKNNNALVQAAISMYDSRMRGVCHSTLPCLHPDDLEEEHQEAMTRTLNEFYSRRTAGENDNEHEEQELRQNLENHYRELVSMNVSNNRWAVQAACSVYTVAMDAACGDGRPRLREEHFEAAHGAAATAARRAFTDRRRGEHHTDDTYMHNIEEVIEEKLPQYRSQNERNPVINYRNTTELARINPLLYGNPVFNPLFPGPCEIDEKYEMYRRTNETNREPVEPMRQVMQEDNKPPGSAAQLAAGIAAAVAGTAAAALGGGTRFAAVAAANVLNNFATSMFHSFSRQQPPPNE